MKKIIFCLIFFISINSIVAQSQLFIQGGDKLKGSERIDGQEYITVYDTETHSYRYFDKLGNEIFLIKSFNSRGEQINLSIEKNQDTNAMEIIISNTAVGFLINSVIYDLDMVKIGRFYRGGHSAKQINDFWSGIDYHVGNISIYDHTGLYRVGSFTLNQTKKINYYAVLGIEKLDNIDQMDAREKKTHIRNTQRLYKKLSRQYNVKRNPDDAELQNEFGRITDAYIYVMEDLGVVDKKKDQKILGFIPKDYFSPEKRSNWSDEEGYVPYINREIKSHQPDSRIQMNEELDLNGR